jgi:hypothetical protein
MSRASDYRQKAADCERQVAQAQDPAIKKHYLTLAEAWNGMAEQAEPTNPQPPGSPKA